MENTGMLLWLWILLAPVVAVLFLSGTGDTRSR